MVRMSSLVAVLCVSAGAVAQTNILNNGSLENPGFDLGTANYRYLDGAGSSLVASWVLTHDNQGEPSYLYHSSRYPAFDGNYAMYLGDGDRFESSFATQAGKTYRASFKGVWFGGAGVDFVIPNIHNAAAYWIDGDGVPTGEILAGRFWKMYSHEFTPAVDNPSTPIYLFNTQDNVFYAGWAIDDIRIDTCIWDRNALTPIALEICQGGSYTITANVGGDGPFTYQWKRNGTDLTGANARDLRFLNFSAGNNGIYTCLVTNACGNVTTAPVSMAVGPRCLADLDDGSGTGIPDCGVTQDDFIYYLGIFETGAPAADLNNDQGVTIDDLILYIDAFNNGC